MRNKEHKLGGLGECLYPSGLTGGSLKKEEGKLRKMLRTSVFAMERLAEAAAPMRNRNISYPAKRTAATNPLTQQR